MSANAPAPNAAKDEKKGVSKPAPAETPKREEPKKESDPKTEQELEPLMMALVSISAVFGGLFYIVFSYGAAKLSYDRFQNIGWAILDFLFPMFYYPYYALNLSGPQQYGGGRKSLIARVLSGKF
jgi:hypothetical protein